MRILRFALDIWMRRRRQSLKTNFMERQNTVGVGFSCSKLRKDKDDVIYKDQVDTRNTT